MSPTTIVFKHRQTGSGRLHSGREAQRPGTRKEEQDQIRTQSGFRQGGGDGQISSEFKRFAANQSGSEFDRNGKLSVDTSDGRA